MYSVSNVPTLMGNSRHIACCIAVFLCFKVILIALTSSINKLYTLIDSTVEIPPAKRQHGKDQFQVVNYSDLIEQQQKQQQASLEISLYTIYKI